MHNLEMIHKQYDSKQNLIKRQEQQPEKRIRILKKRVETNSNSSLEMVDGHITFKPYKKFTSWWILLNYLFFYFLDQVSFLFVFIHVILPLEEGNPNQRKTSFFYDFCLPLTHSCFPWGLCVYSIMMHPIVFYYCFSQHKIYLKIVYALKLPNIVFKIL